MWKSSEAGVAEDQMIGPCGHCEEAVHVVAENQMTGPRGHCGEAVHVTDSNDHECGQVYCNRCNEDVDVYLGYHCVLLERQCEKLTQKNMKCYQMAKYKWTSDWSQNMCSNGTYSI